MFAAAKGHLEIALALLQMGADSKLTDLSGASAVHWALSGQVCARVRCMCMF
jgi:ankyrin repeat protein